MDKKQISKLKVIFDEIVHITEDGIEFWYARELQPLLGYVRWENFVNAIEKAKVSCQTSGTLVAECFRDITKTSPMPNGGIKEIPDVMLARYACCLIAQNGDPHKAARLPEFYFDGAYCRRRVKPPNGRRKDSRGKTKAAAPGLFQAVCG